MADTTRTVAIEVTSSADTSGLDKAKKDLAQMKGEVSDFEAKLDGIINEAENKGSQAGDALGDGVTKGATQKMRGFSLSGVMGLSSTAALGFATGVELAKGVNEGMARMAERGNGLSSFLNLDQSTAIAVERLKEVRAAIEGIYDLLLQPPGDALERALIAIEDRANRARDAIDQAAKLDDIDQKAQQKQTEAWRDEERRQIEQNPDLTPEQKAQDLAKLDQQKLFDEANQRDAERLRKESDAIERQRVAEDKLTGAANAEAAQFGRIGDAAKAEEEAAQYAKEKSKSFGILGQQYRQEDLAKFEQEKLYELRSQGGFGTQEEERAKYEEAKKQREQAEQNALNARQSVEDVRKENTAESQADWQETNQQIKKVDDDLSRQLQPPPEPVKDPGPALEAGANSVSQNAAKAASAAETMVSKVDSAVAQISNSLESMVARLNAIEARTNQLASTVQSESASSKYT